MKYRELWLSLVVLSATMTVALSAAVQSFEGGQLVPALTQQAADEARTDALFGAVRAVIAERPVVECAGQIVVVPASGFSADQRSVNRAGSVTTPVHVVALRLFTGDMPLFGRNALMVDGLSIVGVMTPACRVDLGDHAGLANDPERAQRVAELALRRMDHGEAMVFAGLSYSRAWKFDVTFTDQPWWPFNGSRDRLCEFTYDDWQVAVRLDEPAAVEVARLWGDESARKIIAYHDEVDLVTQGLREVWDAMHRFRMRNDMRWPVLPVDSARFPVWDRDVAQRLTAASLEYLMTVSQHLKVASFQDPRHATPNYWSSARADTRHIAAAPRLEWASWICYDWSAPPDADGTRAVLSHRSPLVHPESGVPYFIVYFANGRRRMVAAEAIPNDGIHSVSWHLPNPYSRSDDLFAPGGERGDMFHPARGDRRWAFLR